MKLIDRESLKPFVKWPGGKTRELKHIIPNAPKYINNYYEPFIGGGAVYFALNGANSYFINDKSKDLIELYQNIQKQNNVFFIKVLNDIDNSWKEIEILFQNNQKTLFNIYIDFRKDNNCKKTLETNITNWVIENKKQLSEIIPKTINIEKEIFISETKINLYRKMNRMNTIESRKSLLSNEDVKLNILTALKSAVYMFYRFLHNNQRELNSEINSAIYYFIRNFSYSSMFRYNSKGQFNVPYGGMGYNKNNLTNKIRYLESTQLKERLDNTTIENLDFFDFFNRKKLNKTDFIFLDPPYDTKFSTYDNNSFELEDQKRLANLLINQITCQWMLIIKNTDFIYNLYKGIENININYFDKKYAVSFMNRNEKKAEHLLITNYVI